MSDALAIDFEFTVEHVFRAKMLNWRRRSLPRYVACGGLVGLGLYFPTNDLHAAFMVFVLISLALLAISLSAIAISSELQVRRKRAAGTDKVRVTFRDDAIDVLEGTHVTTKQWSWIAQVIRTADALALRTRDGLFRQSYLFVARDAARYAALDELLSRRVGRH